MKQLRLALALCLSAALVGTGAAVADVAFSAAGQTGTGQQGDPSMAVDTMPFVLARLTPDQDRTYPVYPPGAFLDRSPGQITYTDDFIDRLPKVAGDEQWRCLTEALYFEARGESVRGQFAVAEVILNRVDSPRFPDTICKVVYQGTGRKFECQFTYSCDGNKETIREPEAWEEVGKVAKLMIRGAPRALTRGATHYHTKSVSPRWSRVYPLTVTIGTHKFYRQPTRTASSRS